MGFIVAVVIHIPIFYSRCVLEGFAINGCEGFLFTFPVLYSFSTAFSGQHDLYGTTFVQAGRLLLPTTTLRKSVFARRA
jgi:hypothetical protein